jgi:hypothetical protein
VRREFEQDFPLDQRFADKAEFEMLKISEAAVNKLGRGRRSRAAQVTLFDKHDREAASLRIAGDTTSVNTPADDGEIMDAILQAWTSHVPSLRCSQTTSRLAIREEDKRRKTKINRKRSV